MIATPTLAEFSQGNQSRKSKIHFKMGPRIYFAIGPNKPPLCVKTIVFNLYPPHY